MFLSFTMKGEILMQSTEVSNTSPMDLNIDPEKQRFPFCIVWTPIPILSYLIPLLGHIGIATSSGIIRDFAGPYVVQEDNMAFGQPTKYWQLKHTSVSGSAQAWDAAISEAAEVYKTRMHNLCCDNCHSFVALALNLMNYNNSRTWNMCSVGLSMTIHGKHIGLAGFLKTWLPFVVIVMGLFILFNLI
ncbi:transmembrane protein 222 [Orussus abietinus]|uniref:transmembrane protein 222 n=1 Tax=Orussus abietinus TaxID=222816 RepID=UPI00062625DD|nr:transmembrane protein 222 [Orussus abietinus]